ncbi:hypothetical protein AAIH25_15015 [Arthrobacter crystallopoietes]|uniref:hypothetical protein n=1 Tax=Crystallibacter crystallopoietes TaxID=37928 RepID=UPI003D1FE618
MSEPFWNVPYAAILNEPGLHESVQLAVTERRDVTLGQLEFLAQRTESAVVINRIIQNRTVPIELIKAIKENARTLEGKVWAEVVEHADRVLTSQRQGEF